jgi:hypothetical protein
MLILRKKFLGILQSQANPLANTATGFVCELPDLKKVVIKYCAWQTDFPGCRLYLPSLFCLKNEGLG